ncbi:MAG: lysophospholipase [Clostridia bacterium]|nr:lysophospholipase [Clostridia bacterium]
MKKEEWKVLSSYDKTELSCLIYEPEETPKAVVQIVHGMCEHKERYENFMRFLAQNGYVAAGYDHRGHGESATKEDYGYFGDRTGEAVVEDCFDVTKELKKRYALPIVLFGHSMGSMVVRCYLQKHETEIEKLIVSGSPSQNPVCSLGIALNKSIGFFKGERHRSATMKKLTTGGDKNFPGEGKNAWLTRDKGVVDAYNADEKCNYTFTCNGFENLLKLMKNTYDQKRYAVKNPALPIFFVAGSDDPVIVSPEKWKNAQDFLRKVGYREVSGKLYHGFRHEVLNEIGKERVYADILDFIELDKKISQKH